MIKALRSVTVLVALSGTLALTGCGEADVAATVDGRVISEAAVKVATSEVNKVATQPFTAAQVLQQLINAPFVLKAAADVGKGQSEAAARSILAVVEDPSPEALTVVRAVVAQNALQADPSTGQKAYDQFVAAVKAAKITVNPRYGHFDPESLGLAPSTPNWIATGS